MSWGDLVTHLVREAVARHDPRGGGRAQRRQRRRTTHGGESSGRGPETERAAGGTAAPPAGDTATPAPQFERGSSRDGAHAAAATPGKPTATPAPKPASGSAADGAHADAGATAAPTAPAPQPVPDSPAGRRPHACRCRGGTGRRARFCPASTPGASTARDSCRCSAPGVGTRRGTLLLPRSGIRPSLCLFSSVAGRPPAARLPGRQRRSGQSTPRVLRSSPDAPLRWAGSVTPQQGDAPGSRCASGSSERAQPSLRSCTSVCASPGDAGADDLTPGAGGRLDGKLRGPGSSCPRARSPGFPGTRTPSTTATRPSTCT